MAATLPLANAVEPWRPNSLPAQWLAQSLRAQRLTLLIGDAGAGKTALIIEGLLPLLHRRADDARVAPAREPSPVVVSFRERRGNPRSRRAEIVVLIDASAAPTLAALCDRLDAALHASEIHHALPRLGLATSVHLLSQVFGARFLFIIDGFEAVLRSPDADASNELLDELVELLNRPLAANLLLALRGDAEIPLARLLARLEDVDHEVLRLLPPEGASAAPALPEPTTTQTTATTPAEAPAPARPEPPVTPPPRWISTRNAAPHATFIAPLWPRALLLALSALIVALGLAALWRESASDPFPAPSPWVAASPPMPTLELLVEREGSLLPRLPLALARSMRAAGQVDLQVNAAVGTASRAEAPSAGSIGLALARYDELQAAAAEPLRPVWSIVAPLYAEEVQVLVRADSPLQWLHELDGRRINVGRDGSSRAIAGAALYRQMFGHEMARSVAGDLDAPAALSALLAGDGLDAVLLVSAGPAPAWGALSPRARAALKTLRADTTHPATRRALQQWLPATLADAEATPTVASLQFLIVRGTPDEAQSATIAAFTRALCERLPALQRDGDPKWRDVRAGLRLPTPWPDAPAAAAAWRDCVSTTTPSTPGDRP